MSNSLRRVVITGMSIFCPLGSTKKEVVANIKQAKTKIDLIQTLNVAGMPFEYAGEIKDHQLEKYFSKRELRKYDRCAQYAIITAERARSDAGLKLEDYLPERVGLTFGTCNGGVSTSYEAYLISKKGERIPTKSFVSFAFDVQTDAISYRLGLKGPKSTISIACASSGNALGYAFDLIKENKLDVAFVGGSDPLSFISLVGFYSLGAMSDIPNSPFSENIGLSLGEGAGFVILEEFKQASLRGAHIYAEVLGYGLSGDAHHPTMPDVNGAGLIRCMEFALANAGVSKEEIEYINAHGTGTAANDIAETLAIKGLFKEYAKKIPVSSTKSYIGHALGAAAILEIIISILCIEDGILPPTVNFVRSRPGCDLNYIPNKPVRKHVDTFMSNNAAFGGNNVSIIIGRFKKKRRLPIRRKERVVVTGIGVVSPIGITKDKFYQSLLERKIGIKEVTKFDMSEYKFRRAGVVENFQPRKIVRFLDTRRIDLLSQFSAAAVKLALDDAGLKITKNNSYKVGLIMAVSKGPLSTSAKFLKSIEENNTGNLPPIYFPYMVMNATAGVVSQAFNIKGYNSTIVGGNSSLNSLCYAYEILRTGINDCLFVASADELSEEYFKIINKFNSVASESRLNGGYKIYSKRSVGFIPGEGSAAVLLETFSSAKQRGARIYGEIVGYGMTSDSSHYIGIDGSGIWLAKAIEISLSDPGLSPEQIGCIYTCARGETRADLKDITALKSVFGNTLKEIPISNVLPNTGHAEATDGINNIIPAILSLTNHCLTPFITDGDLIDDFCVVTDKTTGRQINYSLVEGFSRSGSNFSIVCKRYED